MTTAEPAEPEAAPRRWDRPILETAHTLPDGRLLHVLNLHLRAPLAANIPGQKSGPFAWRQSSAWAEGYFVAAMKRAGQALEARLVVERLFDADSAALIAVAGDFNADDREVPLRILVAGDEETGSGHDADRAGACDQNVFAQEVETERCVDSVAERVEDRADLVRNAVRQGHNVKGRQAQVLGESPLFIHTDPARAGV